MKAKQKANRHFMQMRGGERIPIVYNFTVNGVHPNMYTFSH